MQGDEGFIDDDTLLQQGLKLLHHISVLCYHDEVVRIKDLCYLHLCTKASRLYHLVNIKMLSFRVCKINKIIISVQLNNLI